ncbi:MAG: hypothetical protein EOO73_22075 [Myxococcales bacterium]|nr:MAG: hypothetical protein EOO73_22075 [Myxococcales bacterium]
MSESEPLLLHETGIARLDDGSEAVNVGPIVAALRFLTEGRGDDRGVDETGAPLPDLLSLAFDVVKSIILGGRHADYFRQVKRELDSRAEGDTSLGLAKQAVRHTMPTAALKKAGVELQGRVRKLEEAVSSVMTELAALTAPPEKPAKRPRKRVSRPRAAAPTPERLTKPAKRKKRATPPKPAKKAPPSKKTRKKRR